ncbi:MAG: glycosyltransferase [Kofleriaceae bacterium]
MISLDVTSFYNAGAGGIRSYYQAKARWLPERGVECHFVVPGPTASTERLAGGWLHRVPGPPVGADYRVFGDLGGLRRIIREIDPDVVELGSHYLLPQLVRPALRRGQPVVGFYHADVAATYVAPPLDRAHLPRWLRRLATDAAWGLVRHQHARYAATLTGSHGLAATLTARGVPGVRWVGLGVDTTRFQPRPGPRTGRVGYLGRWARDKELDVLLAAAATIRATTDARLVIAGRGPLAPAVAAAARRGLVEAVGLVPAAAVPTFLTDLDALVVPGRYESFGLAAAEAMACGVPVIAPDRGGAAELVTGADAGVTFAAGSAAGLAAAVATVQAAPIDRRRAWGANGRAAVVRALTWPQVCARIHAVYAGLGRC